MSSLTDTDNPDLKYQGVRGMLVNSNEDEYRAYLLRRSAITQKDDEVKSVREELNNLRNELIAFKQLLKDTIQK